MLTQLDEKAKTTYIGKLKFRGPEIHAAPGPYDIL